ncbi:MAG: TIM barrel protein [Promethearchaeia archaeon]
MGALKKFIQTLEARGRTLDEVMNKLENFKIATPSWAYSEGGTRFHVFKDKEAAQNLYERIIFAGQVQKYTGITPELSIHIPWDKVEDFDKAKEIADENNIRITAINPNLFGEEIYKFGSLTHPSEHVRSTALQHIYECIEIADIFDAPYLSLWFADGTNFPGQGDFIERKHRMQEGLAQVYNKMHSNMTMLLEYKFYEPAFYHTDIPDWGTALLFCQKLGENAKVLVDLGHHPQATNIEFIVANLADEDKLGGFHLNSRKYADDDLTSGSLNPYELFLIFNELNKASADDYRKTAFMLDQSHNLKPKIDAMIQSIISCQMLYAKVLTIDREKIQESQENGDIIAAEEALKAAFITDVTPLLEHFRKTHHIPMKPLQVYRKSDFKQKLTSK